MNCGRVRCSARSLAIAKASSTDIRHAGVEDNRSFYDGTAVLTACAEIAAPGRVSDVIFDRLERLDRRPAPSPAAPPATR
jgi:hypothetical protein